MGTRRSRHNKGRKPLYKYHRDRTDWKRDPRPPGGAGKSEEIWETYLAHVATMSPHAASKFPDMPSATAFNAKRRRDPAFSRRAAEIMAARDLHAHAGKRPIAPTIWADFLMRLPSVKNINALVAQPGMPTIRTVYMQRKRDQTFRRAFDAIIHDPGRVEDRNSRAAERMATFRADPAFNLRMYQARAAAAAEARPLCYPYIVKRRDEHAEILAINDIVPRAFPDQMRADICQEAMLAVLEGKITIAELRANRSQSAWFLRKFYKDNFEDAGHAASLDAMVDEDRTEFEVASAIAAKDWLQGQMNERRLRFETFRALQPPTQLDDVWRSQVSRKQREMADRGLSFDEVAKLLEERRP